MGHSLVKMYNPYVMWIQIEQVQSKRKWLVLDCLRNMFLVVPLTVFIWNILCFMFGEFGHVQTDEDVNALIRKIFKLDYGLAHLCFITKLVVEIVMDMIHEARSSNKGENKSETLLIVP